MTSSVKLLVALIGLLVLTLVAGALVVTVLLTRDEKGQEASGDTDVVVLEPAAVEVPDPFTDSVAVAEQPIMVDPEPTAEATAAPEGTTGAGGGVVLGSAPGLYGGTQDQQACDQDQMVEFLEDDQDKAEAWAKAQDIETDEIPRFIDGLTPVVLRRDTRVVNHGYHDGRATPYAAVLQAGSAVLVDEYGIPRAKCSCGNPLGEARPVTTATRYRGNQWLGFDPERVVVVKVDVKVSVIVLVDPQGEPFGRPVGTSGSEDTEATGGDVGSGDDETGGTSEGTAAPKLDEIASIAGVSNGPTAPSVLTLPAARVTAIATYHWNNQQGAAPGTIALRGEDGTLYGPFLTTGSPGQGGVPNAYWTAITNFQVPAGRYTVVDSSPDTWAWAPDTGGRGMVTVWGVAEGAPEQDGSRGEEAKQAITSRFCSGFSEYVTWVRARETDTELYRVEVHIELDSGEWTAKFDVDFATEFGPEIRPVNDESGDLLCG
ncbi:MAG: hypothetical protein Q7J48_14845 [Nocardioides sp.]|nr:hypothetical protein [Nocardioides sp.]